MRGAWIFLVIWSFSAMSLASDERTETLADIRQSLTAVHVEISKLRRELIPTDKPDGLVAGDTLLGRVDSVEQVLRYLTSKTEELEYRINQIVVDGTNRIGDLEFRLVDLEGGDVSQLGEISTLGGDTSSQAVESEVKPNAAGLQMAVGEQADFSRASQALEQEDYAQASALFAKFVSSYPGGPLNPQAFVLRGKALESLGDVRAAARSYLDSYSRHPHASVAPEALLRLGLALDGLKQSKAACRTLGEVTLKFPQSEQVAQAQSMMQTLNCS
jgi:tol-pal system protein YbgF